MSLESLHASELGKTTVYPDQYDAGLLFPIPRAANRVEIAVPTDLPFHGLDTWNAYEVSWLNNKGKPEVAIAEVMVDCTSINLIESKSFKLYFNSLNQTRFANVQELHKVVVHDLAEAARGKVQVNLITATSFEQQRLEEFAGECLDDLDIEVNTYQLAPELLHTDGDVCTESLYSHLLKSNCPVTSQPDWGSVLIRYQGKHINHEALLQYLISFRSHNEFHEQCVERIFMDIMQRCQPEKLTVYARYTRRGGLDINPFRSNFEDSPENIRIARQ